MDWQAVIDAAKLEAQHQGVVLDVVSHSERPDRHYVLMTLEPAMTPQTLGIHVHETIATKDKVG